MGKKIVYYRQMDEMDCGPSCLAMICGFYNVRVLIQNIRNYAYSSKYGVNLGNLSNAAEKLGFRAVGAKVRYIVNDSVSLMSFPLPCIAYWNQKHFVVVYKINRRHVWIADPAHGKIKLTKEQFEKSWCSDGDKGIVLGLEPTPEFYKKNLSVNEDSSNSWASLFQYLRPYRRLIIQFVIGIIAGLLLQVMFPFLTQSLIDVGVQNQNLNFVWLILIAQLVLFTS